MRAGDVRGEVGRSRAEEKPPIPAVVYTARPLAVSSSPSDAPYHAVGSHMKYAQSK